MRRLSAVLALLGFLLPATVAAAATAPREFYGVIAANDPDQTELARMGAGGVGTLRINLVWAAVQSGPDAELDWTYYDRLIGDAARAGIRVLATVYSSPPWSAVRNHYPPSRRTRGRFAHFVRSASARYGSGGAFWAEHPDIPKLPVRDWQLWNEPNLQLFWPPNLSVEGYVRLLRIFSGAVRLGDPSARVLLAGLFPTPSISGFVIGVPLGAYLSAIYRQKRVKSLFDGVALHPYGSTPLHALRWIKRARRVMSRFRDRKTPIWITEIGWTTQGSPSPLTVSLEQQAANLNVTYRLLGAVRRRHRISGVVWYSWRDIRGFGLFDHTGLFTEDFRPKPSWHAFVGLTGGSP